MPTDPIIKTTKKRPKWRHRLPEIPYFAVFVHFTGHEDWCLHWSLQWLNNIKISLTASLGSMITYSLFHFLLVSTCLQTFLIRFLFLIIIQHLNEHKLKNSFHDQDGRMEEASSCLPDMQLPHTQLRILHRSRTWDSYGVHSSVGTMLQTKCTI